MVLIKKPIMNNYQKITDGAKKRCKSKTDSKNYSIAMYEKGSEVDLQLKFNSQKIQQKVRRRSIRRQEAVENELKKLIEIGHCNTLVYRVRIYSVCSQSKAYQIETAIAKKN